MSTEKIVLIRSTIMESQCLRKIVHWIHLYRGGTEKLSTRKDEQGKLSIGMMSTRKISTGKLSTKKRKR